MIRSAFRRLSAVSSCAGWAGSGMVALLPLIAAAHAPASAPALANLGGAPLFFEANQGQAGAPAQFVARGPNYQFLVEPAGVQFVLRQEPAAATAPRTLSRLSAPRQSGVRTIRLEFLGANAQAQLRGQEPLAGKVNYLLGSDPAQWQVGVSSFAQVQARQLYPGIDVVYYGNQRHLEYDFQVAPGADPSAIALHFEGVDSLSVNAQGELVLKVGQSELRQHRPELYQVIKGVRQSVRGGYRLRDSSTAAFAVGPYDPSSPLIIDPVLSYSTYFGGDANDLGSAIKVDAARNIYIAGQTLSSQFRFAIPTPTFQRHFHGGFVNGDAFVAKFDPTGTNLIFFTYLGGTLDDAAFDMALDGANNVFVTGGTDSPNFPTTAGALSRHIHGTNFPNVAAVPYDAFVAELSADGTRLIYSTFLGGNKADIGGSIAVDAAGNAYVTGYTYSTNFPTLNAVQPRLNGNADAFVAKLAPGGNPLIYSTFLGGGQIDEGEGIAADDNGFAYVAGYTASKGFPHTPGAFQTNLNNRVRLTLNNDAFVTRLTPEGQIVYSTFLGGFFNDYGYRIATDGAGNAFVAGTTQSTNFPVSVTATNLHVGGRKLVPLNYDAFLAKLAADGSLAYSTVFGGNLSDIGWGVAVDRASGSAFVIGSTTSTNFPVTVTNEVFRTKTKADKDVFVVGFDSSASNVAYSVVLGGSGNDFGYGIALDSDLNAYIVGQTVSTNFPTVAPLQPRLFRRGQTDGFIGKIAP